MMYKLYTDLTQHHPIIETDSKEEMRDAMGKLLEQDHESFLDMILTVDGIIKLKTLFLLSV